MIQDFQRKADTPMSAEAGKLFEEWLASDQGMSIHNMSVFKPYDPPEDSMFFLQNKLRRAFEAGMTVGDETRRQKVITRFTNFIA